MKYGMNAPKRIPTITNLHERVASVDPDINDLVQRAMADLDGGTFDDGHKIAQAILRKRASGQPLRNILIEGIETDILRDSLPGFAKTYEVEARQTPLNRGLAVGFGFAPDEASADSVMHQFNTSRATIALGNTGLVAAFEPVYYYDSMTAEEHNGFTRSAGFAVLPRLPLIRAYIVE
jgi:hypothetical protein